ncbi:MAG: TVP38/TMEM64 family protein [Desulfobacterales bacterium]|nr:TVP38/TMEM64 family protein [Desulfobacterales bacterium]
MSRPAKTAILLAAAGLIGVAVFLNWSFLAERVTMWYGLIKDPEQVRTLLRAWGPIGGPLAFMGIQILQVVFAPLPGEASGFIGGYIFGTIPAFVYSSVGLTAGSMINFTLARFLGRRYVAKLIPAGHLSKFDSVARHQGAILFFLFFVVPGFPKDYLCIFLGLTSLSVKVFSLMAGIGRMPGTLMLSLQGAHVFQQNYATLILLVAISLALVIPAYFWRERIYSWIDRINSANNIKS